MAAISGHYHYPSRPYGEFENPEDFISDKIWEPVLQLRRKLCSSILLSDDPSFLIEYDKGLSLEQALEEFKVLWNTQDREKILIACVKQKRSNGGNVILRMAAAKGCVDLFQIIGIEILQQEERGQIDKNFKAHFSCHFLEAAMRNNDLELFQSLWYNPEIQKALSVEGVTIPSSSYNPPTPLTHLSQIPLSDPQTKIKFILMLKGTYESTDPIWLEMRVLEDYLIAKRMDEAKEQLKKLISTYPNAPLSDSAAIIKFYIQMIDENQDMANLFPQQDPIFFSFEKKLTYLFLLKAEEIQAVIYELAQDVQKCEKLCSQEIDISDIYSALEDDGVGEWIPPMPIKKAFETLKEFQKQIDGRFLEQSIQTSIRKFLWDIPLKTWAFLATQPEWTEQLFSYFIYMHNAQLAVIIPQLSPSLFLHYVEDRIFSENKNFEIRIFQTATQKQLDYFVQHFDILKNPQVELESYYKKLEELQNRKDKTDMEAKRAYWDLDRQFYDTMFPLSIQINLQQEHLKLLKDRFLELSQNSSSELQQSAIDQLKERIDHCTASTAASQAALASLPNDLASLRDSCGIEIPDEYLCPITWELMRNPVTDIYGHTYESSAIKQAIGKSPLSPLMRGPLTLADLKDNIELKGKIETWKKENGAAI